MYRYKDEGLRNVPQGHVVLGRAGMMDREPPRTELASAHPAGTELASAHPAGTGPAGTGPAGAEPARTELHRHPERGSHDLDVIFDIVDSALLCHVGFDHDGAPVVIPTVHGRDGTTLYLHGSPASRMLRGLASGIDVCVGITLVDELVLAKSWFHHSLNYRSVVVFGRATVVGDPDVKTRALRLIVDHIRPGRSAEARPPNAKELAGTLVLAVPLTESSAKVRSGPPLDDAEDADFPVWSGVVKVTSPR